MSICRPIQFLAALAVVLSVSLSGCEQPKVEPTVMVLGVDGGTWTVIEPMMEAGELPNFKRLYDRGLHGVLESRPPVVSPVVWTTIFTGRPHEEHGIVDWKTSQSQHRKVEALWNITRERGMRTHVFNVPGSWPPEPVEGVMLSGFPLSGSTFAGNTGHVANQRDLTIKRVPTAYRSIGKLILDQVQPLAPGEWTAWFDAPIQQHPTWTGTMRAKRLANGEQYYLTPWYRTDPGLVTAYPEELRAEVSKQIGLPYIHEGPGWSKHDEEHTPEYLYEHLVQVFDTQSEGALRFVGEDWRLFINVMTLVDRVSHPYWAYSQPEEYEGIDLERAAKYESAVADSYRETDRRIGQFLDRAPGDPYVVLASDHGFKASKDKTKHIGTHEYDGIYLVAGPGIKPGRGERAFIEDMGATLLYLLGLPVGEDMQGTVIDELPGMLGAEVLTIPSYEAGARAGTEAPVDESTWRQLRELGYVDGPAPGSKEAMEAKAKEAAAAARKAKEAAAKEAVKKAVEKPTAKKPAVKKPAAKKPAVPEGKPDPTRSIPRVPAKEPAAKNMPTPTPSPEAKP